MALPDETLRDAFAPAVPVYVRAAGDSYELVDTASDEALGTYDTTRQALVNAFEREDVAALIKRANLRTDGEPDGEWRWLDASATEDEPIDGARIGDEALWEMAASLNARKSAIPINGGGAPEGLGNSEPHGDAKHKDGAHLANGFAHVGLVVVESDERAHLYLYSELLPEIAREVDRGRLAYGSVFFGFAEVDEDDNFAVSGAVLISHALTNDPAVTTLTAGSERKRAAEFAHVGTRSRRMTMSKKKLDAIAHDAKQTPKARVRAALDLLLENGTRGPMAEVQKKLCEVIGITEQELAANPWALEDSVHAVKVAVQLEKKLEAAAPPAAPAVEAPPPDAAGIKARVRSKAWDTLGEVVRQTLHVMDVRRNALRAAIALFTAERAEMAPDEEKAKYEQLLAWGREVTGKAEATLDEIIAELDARKEEAGKIFGTDVPPKKDEGEPPAAEADDAGDEEEEDDDEEKQAAAQKSRAEARSWVELEARSRHLALDEKLVAELSVDAVRSRVAVERELGVRAQVMRFETRRELDGEIAKRENSVKGKTLGLVETEREKLVDVWLRAGREVVITILDTRNAAPIANVLDGKPAPQIVQPAGQTEAYDACMDDAQRELDADEEKRAKRERRAVRSVERHVVRAQAQKIARERFPELFREAPAL